MYTIHQLSEMLKVNSNAIRFYEKKGLIHPKRSENGYRTFNDGDISRLQLILTYRKMGFSIDVIKKLLEKHEGQDLISHFAAQYEYLNDHIHAMHKIRTVLSQSLESMISETLETETLIESMKQTAEIIEASNRWMDLWHFDQWAENYDVDIRRATTGLDFYANYDDVISKTAEHVIKKVTSGKHQPRTIVEIGIGTGNLAKTIEKGINVVQNSNVVYCGIDQSINMLKIAKKKCPDISVKLGTFLKLPLEDRIADVVVTSYAFHHCNEEEKMLSLMEMDRILKRDGKIVITDLMFKDDASRLEYEKSCRDDERADLEDEFFGTVYEIEKVLLSLEYQVCAEQIDALIWTVTAQK